MYGDDLPRIMANPDVWFVCGPCHEALPDVPPGVFGTAIDSDGNEHGVQIG
jgi:hypothetical protein